MPHSKCCSETTSPRTQFRSLIFNQKSTLNKDPVDKTNPKSAPPSHYKGIYAYLYQPNKVKPNERIHSYLEKELKIFPTDIEHVRGENLLMSVFSDFRAASSSPKVPRTEHGNDENLFGKLFLHTAFAYKANSLILALTASTRYVKVPQYLSHTRYLKVLWLIFLATELCIQNIHTLAYIQVRDTSDTRAIFQRMMSPRRISQQCTLTNGVKISRKLRPD